MPRIVLSLSKAIIALLLALSASLQPIGIRLCSCACEGENQARSPAVDCGQACGDRCEVRARESNKRKKCAECSNTRSSVSIETPPHSLVLDWHLCQCPEGCNCEARHAARSTFVRDLKARPELDERFAEAAFGASLPKPAAHVWGVLFASHEQRVARPSLARLCRFLI
jgi:hypothetical protein